MSEDGLMIMVSGKWRMINWMYNCNSEKNTEIVNKRYRDSVSKSNHMCVCLLLPFLFQPLDIILLRVTHP